MTTKQNCGTCKYGLCMRTPTGRVKKGEFVVCLVTDTAVRQVLLSITPDLPTAYRHVVHRVAIHHCGTDPTDGTDCKFWEARQ